MLVDLVDEEGGLTLTVNSSGFGADPAPDTEKQLSIRYSYLSPFPLFECISLF